jgi:hypothetical protein
VTGRKECGDKINHKLALESYLSRVPVKHIAIAATFTICETARLHPTSFSHITWHKKGNVKHKFGVVICETARLRPTSFPEVFPRIPWHKKGNVKTQVWRSTYK